MARATPSPAAERGARQARKRVAARAMHASGPMTQPGDAPQPCRWRGPESNRRHHDFQSWIVVQLPGRPGGDRRRSSCKSHLSRLSRPAVRYRVTPRWCGLVDARWTLGELAPPGSARLVIERAILVRVDAPLLPRAQKPSHRCRHPGEPRRAAGRRPVGCFELDVGVCPSADRRSRVPRTRRSNAPAPRSPARSPTPAAPGLRAPPHSPGSSPRRGCCRRAPSRRPSTRRRLQDPGLRHARCASRQLDRQRR